MKLYLQLVRQFSGAGVRFGFIAGAFMAIVSNLLVGLAWGFCSGILFVGITSLILTVMAGRKDRPAVRS